MNPGVKAGALDTSAASAQAADGSAYGAAGAISGFYHKGMTRAQMEKTAKDFESVFLSQMLQPMFEGLTADPEFGGGPGEDQWRSVMLDEYGKSIAAGGGVGIAKQVMKVMLQAQEAAEGKHSADTGASPIAPTKAQALRYLQPSLPSPSLNSAFLPIEAEPGGALADRSSSAGALGNATGVLAGLL